MNSAYHYYLVTQFSLRNNKVENFYITITKYNVPRKITQYDKKLNFDFLQNFENGKSDFQNFFFK